MTSTPLMRIADLTPSPVCWSKMGRRICGTASIPCFANEFAKQGIEAVPQILLPIFDQQTGDGVKSAIRINGVEVMPLSGISDKMTVVCNQNGDYLTYRSDEHGFHHPKGNWGSRNLEIAAVGNSFTMGYCVPSEKNFVALMRERCPAILNLGMA